MSRKEALEKDKYRSSIYKVGNSDAKSRKRRLQTDEEDIPKGGLSHLAFTYF